MSQNQNNTTLPLNAYIVTSNALAPVRGTIAQSEVWDLIKQYIQRDSMIVIWAVNEVAWGTYQSGTCLFSNTDIADMTSYWLEMRIFNDCEELHLIRKDDTTFSYRYITDTAGENVSAVDSTSRLMGENSGNYVNIQSKRGFTTLVDTGRKLTQIIPIETTSQYCYLTTRNYIGYLHNHQASYVDYRYVAIVDEEV